jgi:hypothetical protein
MKEVLSALVLGVVAIRTYQSTIRGPEPRITYKPDSGNTLLTSEANTCQTAKMADPDVLSNQHQILDNQKHILENQKAILDNQKIIQHNQESLALILKNQEKILALLQK